METQFQLDGVTVAFDSTDGLRKVLEDIDVTIRHGEFVAVVGRNGSGKSTLGKVLTGLCDISRGVLTSEGTARIVFQNPEAQIVGETVYEDVCFGLENSAVDPALMPERASTALRQVGLEHLIDQPVAGLSGGQKQLLGIAGCLAVQADAIVFDEATAMLDPASRARVLQVAQELHRAGQTIVWITQWMDELAHVERVIALEAGRVVFDGSNRAFFYEEDTSACERLGFVPPYTVQVVQELRKRGVPLRFDAISPVELHEAVSAP